MSFTDEDIKKIEELYSRHGKEMYAIAYRILKDENSAEDIVQQSFLKIMDKLDRVDLSDENKTKKFLMIIARNLAIDVYNINQPYTEFEKTQEFYWMKENSYKYGYILRYPKDKEFITGYQYEPWHYRYVGVKIATYLYKNNLTYDEYFIRNLEK